MGTWGDFLNADKDLLTGHWGRYAHDLSSGAGSAWNAVTGHVTPPSMTSGPIPQMSQSDQATATHLLSLLKQGREQQQQAFGQESGLADQLNAIANGTAGTSPAAAQLGQGLQQIESTQLAGAAGASGEDAALANRQAMQNIGQAQVGTNQSAALLRANEEMQARQSLGGLLSAMANQGQASYNSNLSGAQGFSGEAMGGMLGLQQLNTQVQQNNANNQAKLLNSIIGGVAGGAATGGLGGSTTAAMGPTSSPATSFNGLATAGF